MMRTPAWMSLSLATALVSACPAQEADKPAEEVDATLAKMVEPSVVAILHENAGGSGFVLTPDGYILSNGHVVMNPDDEDPKKTAERITVVLYNDRKYKARVIGHSLDPDVSLLKIDLEPGMELTPVRIADSRKAQVEQQVIAVGMPNGLKQTYTKGILSNVERTDLGTFTKIFHMDAALNPGNSGGPLFNERGEVLGLNTYGGGGEGMGFTIPIHVAMVLKDHFLEHGRFRRADIPGLQIQEIYDELGAALGISSGVLVDFVEPGSAAEKAGFATSDVIVEMDGNPVAARTEAQLLDFNWELTILAPGRTVSFKILRGMGDRRQDLAVSVVLEEGEPQPKHGHQLGEIPEHRFDDLGLGVRQIVALSRWIQALPNVPGVLATSVTDNGPAQKAGLAAGDILTAIDGKPVKTPQEFVAGIEGACKTHRKAIVLDVQRKNLTFKTALAPFYELAGKRVALMVPPKDAEHIDLIRRFFIVNGADVDIWEARGVPPLPPRNENLDALVLVGGPGAKTLWNDDLVQEVVRDTLQKNKTIGAIGAAAVTLVNADKTLIDRRVKVTTHEDFSSQMSEKKANYTGKDVEADGKVITTTGVDKDKVKAFLRRVRSSITQSR